MESTAARALAEAKKSPQDKVRDKFQAVLDAMEQHIIQHPDKYRSAKSDRLIFVRTIAEMIYLYYQRPKLIDTFDERLKFFLDKEASNKTAKKEAQEDLSNTSLLPKLNPIFVPIALPLALFTFHEIMVKAKQDATAINKTTWLGSDLNDKIVAAAAGHEPIAQELATNLYLVVFSSQLDEKIVNRFSVEYANYLRECLTDKKIYRADRTSKPNHSFVRESSANQSASMIEKKYNFIFAESREDAMFYMTKNNYYNACCFGTEFSFTLVKEKPTDHGQFMPLLSSVQHMDVWKVTDNPSPTTYHIREDAQTKEFVGTIARRPSPSKQ